MKILFRMRRIPKAIFICIHRVEIAGRWVNYSPFTSWAAS